LPAHHRAPHYVLDAAVWSVVQVGNSPLARGAGDADRTEAYRSVLRLHLLDRAITVLPAHDLAAIRDARLDAD
jgi:N-acyl homoserine lactone hydrolase